MGKYIKKLLNPRIVDVVGCGDRQITVLIGFDFWDLTPDLVLNSSFIHFVDWICFFVYAYPK